MNTPLLEQGSSVKVLHAATFEKAAGGILEQLRSEHRAVQQLGLPWDIRLWSKDEAVEPFIRPIPADCGPLRRRYIFAREILRVRHEYDAILIRYDTNNPFLLWAGRRLPLWVSEHHAIEYLERLIGGSLKGRILSRVEKVFGRLLLSGCDGIVAVTDEILCYQQSRVGLPVPGRVLPNGIDAKAVQIAPDERGDAPKLFFVATNFLPWHGLPEVLAALAKFPEPVELHLIGNINADLMQQIQSHSRRSQIFTHGFVDSRAMPSLLAKADVSLSAFNSIATGLTQASRLKVRHMLAMGVPVIGGEADASFPADFRFYAQAPTVDLQSIVEYAVACRAATRGEIRAAAVPYIDKAAIINDQYNWLRTLHERRRSGNR